MSRHPRALERPFEPTGAAAGPVGVRPASVPRAVPDVEPARSAREVEVDAQINALLARILVQERLAENAQPDPRVFLGWPSWSMETGLSQVQEQFVEHWSPQRVLDDSRRLRQLLVALQRWTTTHRDDAGLTEALSTFATTQAP